MAAPPKPLCSPNGEDEAVRDGELNGARWRIGQRAGGHQQQLALRGTLDSDDCGEGGDELITWCVSHDDKVVHSRDDPTEMPRSIRRVRRGYARQWAATV